ncbi:MAG: Fe-S cluster assembly protein SufD [Bacteroidota bacterium]
MSTVTEKRNLTTELVQQLRQENSASARQSAIAQFESVQLPAAKAEEYRFAPIARLLEKHFTVWPAFNAPSSKTELHIESAIPAGLEAAVIVLVNGIWSEKWSSVQRSEAKVSWTPIAGVPVSNDPFALLNQAAVQYTLSIDIPASANIETPFVVLYVNDASQPVSTHTRLQITLGEGSKAGIIQRTLNVGHEPIFHTVVEEIKVHPRAHLDYYKIQDDPGQIIQVNNTLIRQSEESQVNTFTLTMDGLAIRNNLTIAIDGERCESHFHGLYLLKGDTLADNHTVVDHIKPNSFSNEMYKGVMDEQSKAVFNGKIFVRPHAQKTNAFQSNRNILLSDKATINTKPQLEIWADDVKCSHGCTTGQLDEEALFYLRARGIHEDTARAMLLYAFASEVLQHVPNETLRTYMDQLVSERLHKDF